MSQKLIQIVEAVKAVQRIPSDVADVTFFSESDVWLYNAIVDERLCDRCHAAQEIGVFLGDEIRRLFPRLEIMTAMLIMVNLHPNCRCFLYRLIQEE